MFKKREANARPEAGFTLVEMILVVTVIGIISAVLISTINQKTQKQRAIDAVNRSSMEQVQQALESYMAAEGRYPAAVNNQPDMNSARVQEYLTKWPEGFMYVTNGSGSQFAAYVIASQDNYLKYDSAWGEIRVCAPTTISQLGFCTNLGQ